jgi:protein involved in polysaccharide export with SLBB domain
MKATQRIIYFILAFALLFTMTSCATSQPAATPAEVQMQAAPRKPAPYVIHPGDQLDIKFFYNPELNESVVVRPDGKISLQLIDEIHASGLQPSELDQKLTDLYSNELKKPVLTVIVRSFTGQRVYVGGEVNRQGLITLQPGLTALQAVFQSGGFMETAQPAETLIIRKGPDAKPIPLRIDLSEVMAASDPNADFMLQPDDIVYVPKSAIARANKFVRQYIEELLLFRGVSLGFTYELHSDSNN